jgi:protein-tyrosine phosphatase
MERDLGIRNVLDFRTSVMHAELPSKLGVMCVSLRLFSDEAAEQARSTLDVSPRTFMRGTRDRAEEAVIARVFALLADESSYPLVFHCATGKDRTGSSPRSCSACWASPTGTSFVTTR